MSNQKNITAKEIINVLYRHSVVSLIDEQQILTISEKSLSKLTNDLIAMFYPEKNGDEIIDCVLNFYHLNREDIDNKINRTRNRVVVECRVIIATLLSLRTKMTLEQIADIFGLHHSTVIHYKKIFNDWYATDKAFKEKVNKIKDSLKI